MAFGIQTTNIAGAIQMVDTDVYCRVQSIGTATAIAESPNGLTYYHIAIPGNELLNNKWIMVRNTGEGTQTTNLVNNAPNISSGQLAGSITKVYVPYSGTYSWCVISEAGWVTQSDYGLQLKKADGSIAFTSNQANFVVTDIVSIPLTTYMCATGSYLNTDYTVSRGGRPSGDLYGAPLANAQFSLNTAPTSYQNYRVWYRFISPTSIRVTVYNFGDTEGAAGTGLSSTTLRIIIGLFI